MAAPQLPGTPNNQPPAGAPGGTPPAGAAPNEPVEELEEEEEEDGAPGGAPPVVGRAGAPMSEQAISERVARAQRNWNRKTYGTADPDKIAQIQAKRSQEAAELEALRTANAAYKTKEEETARASMTDLERVTAERDKYKTENEQLRSQLKDKDTAIIAGQQDVVITNAVAEHLDPEAIDLAKFKLQKHLGGLKPAEIATFNQRKLSKWFKDYAEKNPKFAKTNGAAAPEETLEEKAAKAAKAAAAAAGAPPVRPTRVVPATTPRRAAPPARPTGTPGAATKTVKPGPQQMSKKELDNTYRKTTGRKLPW